MNTQSNVAAENIDRTVTGLKDGMASATATFSQAGSAMQNGVQKAIKSSEDAMSFGQGNVEAMFRSGQILATGMQEISQSMAAGAKASLDDSVGALKAMTAVRSFKDLFDLQSSLMRSAMERAVAQSGQLTESTLKLSEQAFAPVSARIALATSKFGQIG